MFTSRIFKRAIGQIVKTTAIRTRPVTQHIRTRPVIQTPAVSHIHGRLMTSSANHKEEKNEQRKPFESFSLLSYGIIYIIVAAEIITRSYDKEDQDTKIHINKRYREILLRLEHSLRSQGADALRLKINNFQELQNELVRLIYDKELRELEEYICFTGFNSFSENTSLPLLFTLLGSDHLKKVITNLRNLWRILHPYPCLHDTLIDVLGTEYISSLVNSASDEDKVLAASSLKSSKFHELVIASPLSLIGQYKPTYDEDGRKLENGSITRVEFKAKFAMHDAMLSIQARVNDKKLQAMDKEAESVSTLLRSNSYSPEVKNCLTLFQQQEKRKLLKLGSDLKRSENETSLLAEELYQCLRKCVRR